MKDLTTSPQLLDYLTSHSVPAASGSDNKSFQSSLRQGSSSSQNRSPSKKKLKSKAKEHTFHAPKESILEEEEEDGAVIVASKANTN